MIALSSSGVRPGFSSTSMPRSRKMAAAARVHLVGDEDAHLFGHVACLPRPVEPRPERFDVGGVDRRAAPDAKARRCVAIGADVVSRVLLLRAASRSPSAAPCCASASERSANCRQTDVFERIAGSAGEMLDPVRCAAPSDRAPRHWRRRARSAPSRPPIRSAQSSANSQSSTAQHRGRVDRLALEDAVDQLAAFGQAEDLGQRPRRRLGFRAARPRAG